jgi:hypothetical protein
MVYVNPEKLLATHSFGGQCQIGNSRAGAVASASCQNDLNSRLPSGFDNSPGI